MDAMRRARRFTWHMLISGLVVMWVVVAAGSALALSEGRLWWPRVVLALVAGVAFSALYPRSVAAILDRRRQVRIIAVMGVLAALAAGLGGAEPVGWGFVPMVWLSVAVLGVGVRAAVLLSLGTFAVCVTLAVVSGPGGEGLPGPWLSMVVYALWCAVLPPSNRMWNWIWTLAVQAHEGREAHARLAVAEERLRFARDLHDLVGHQLSAIAVKTELAVRLTGADLAAARAEMTEVNTLTRKALKELRQAVRGYRELDLSAELESVRSVLEAAGVRCRVRLPYRDLPDGVAPVFAYAVREAVTNVLKHSAATFCDITLRFTEEEAELSVRNDGVVRRQVADLGSGLSGMGERLAALGGAVSARPVGDGEFLLNAVVSLPLSG
uniref:sensor histidine kinase n=1 Tax=Nonomuraea pusilla TaxID=46177 RepID=UPI0006E2292A|nr:histidine kinase [Nonomuraea pusilla]